MTSWTNILGGSAVRPAQPSYLALSIAANTALNWPLETTEGSPVVAAMLDITATAAGLELLMPPGDTGSNGAQSTVTNVGAISFTLTDTSGNPIAVMAPGVAWVVALINNTTANGTWRAVQLGATTSNAQAGALAGGGLQANGSTLQTEMAPVALSANTFITSLYRANAVTWTGASGALTFDTIANLTTGWYCAVQNSGTGALTLGASGGNTINSLGSIVLEPGAGGFVVADTAANFVTFGAQVGPLSILNGGTGASTSSQALTNLGGTTVGVTIFTAASVAAVAALLSVREQLQAPITIYVSPAGSDANNGLTSGTPVATIQRAWNILESGYDLNGYQATISLAAGTYTTPLQASGRLVGQQDINGAQYVTPTVWLQGNSNPTLACAADCIGISGGASLLISGLTLTSSGGSAVACQQNGVVLIGTYVVFGACAGEHMLAKQASTIITSANYSITGGATSHVYCTRESQVIFTSAGVAISGTPAFAGQFVYCDTCASVTETGAMTYSGSATGVRYTVQLNGVIYTNGGGANYYPGNAAGSAATGGQYA